MQSGSPRLQANTARTRPPSLRTLKARLGLLLGLAAFGALGAYVFSLDSNQTTDAGGELEPAPAAPTEDGEANDEQDGADYDDATGYETSGEEPATAEQTVEQAGSEADDGAEENAGQDEPSADGVQNFIVDLNDPLDLTPATATVDLALNPTSGEVCYAIDIEGMASPYDGHIHVGPAGVKGGIVVDLGALSGDAPVGCIENSPVDTQSILTDLGGHYVEFHDPDGTRTVRAQLAAADPATPALVDEDGSVIIIEADEIRLVGDVPDQVTIDKLVESFADVDLGTTSLDASGLTITPGAPRPSGRILVDDAVLFGVDADELPDTDLPVIDTLATIFNARPAWQLTVVGHTDDTGSSIYNLELSLRRADAVRAALGERGVPVESIRIEGAGSTAPIAPNDTPEGRSRNRRIEFEVQAG